MTLSIINPDQNEPINILYVEDDPDHVVLLCRALSGADQPHYRLHHVGSIKDMHGPLREEHIDIILLDLSLPDSSGLQTIEMTRELAPEQAIVVLTNESSQTRALETVKAGAQDFLTKGTFTPGLLKRVIFNAVERNKDRQKLIRLAHFDQLTGLPNRAYFTEKLSDFLNSAARHNRSFALLLIDIDHFKLVNDTKGHVAGDHFLCEVAKRISSAIRASDFLARLGGDEFILILECEASLVKEPNMVSEKILAALEKPITFPDQSTTQASCSIGIAGWDSSMDEPDPTMLIQHSDRAMYKAKQLGGKGFCFYDDELDRQAAIRRHLHAGLKLALDNHEFCLHYQPIFRPQSSSISGIEALLRWYDPKRGITLPGTFISVLEETNLILNVGAWVLNEACAQFQQWLREGRIQPTCWISVNVSPKQFIDNQIVEAVKNTILETQIRPENLHLEITEGILNDNSERTMDCLTELTRIGVHLSVDDFGTGFSSMQYLKSLPVQSLKIDQNFVQNYLQNPDDNSITRAIVQLAHSLGKEVVAEGVEDPQLETAMTEIGCDYLQGYYSSKPLPADAFISNFHYH